MRQPHTLQNTIRLRKLNVRVGSNLNAVPPRVQEVQEPRVEKFDAHACRIQHRTGRLGLGEVSVYVVVRAVHRDAAFEAARYALEELKARVAVWKNEYYADGSSAYLEGTEVPRPERPRDVDDAREPGSQS